LHASARRPPSAAALLIGAALAIIAAHAFDGWAYDNLVWARIYETDFGRMLRIFGFAPFWLLAAAALTLHDWPLRSSAGAGHALRRGTLLFAAAATGGIVAEPLKLLLRRERPWAHDGEYVFRSFAERPLSTGGLALPSSHALVAFAAAAMLARLLPRARAVWYLAAAGCALSRVLAGAHFVSDVVVAAVVGWFTTALLWRFATRAPAMDSPAAFLQHRDRRTPPIPNLERR
jgi:membrane-associated phospholipid phosphatase